jgi:hypothetical protein
VHIALSVNNDAQAELYQFQPGSSNPAKDYDHALDALRYLIYKLDGKRLARKKWFWQRDNKDRGGGETVEVFYVQQV